MRTLKKMFITARDGVNRLHQSINNESFDKHVALHEVVYSVDWVNISSDLDNNWLDIDGKIWTV